MKYVLFYETAPDVASNAPTHFPAHKAWYQGFHARGLLQMLGPFANPQDEGTMAIFSTREGAEEFAAGDPFVLNGVVSRWYVREWREALTD